MPLSNEVLSVAEAIAKGLAALAVGLYFTVVVVAWARGRGAGR